MRRRASDVKAVSVLKEGLLRWRKASDIKWTPYKKVFWCEVAPVVKGRLLMWLWTSDMKWTAKEMRLLMESRCVEGSWWESSFCFEDPSHVKEHQLWSGGFWCEEEAYDEKNGSWCEAAPVVMERHLMWREPMMRKLLLWMWSSTSYEGEAYDVKEGIWY